MKGVLFYFLFSAVFLQRSFCLIGFDRISEGIQPRKDQFPFFIQLRTSLFQNDTFQVKKYCSGVLVDTEWVLTAGHCFPYANELKKELINSKQIIAIAGTYIVDDRKAQIRHVIEIHRHLKYAIEYDKEFEDFVEDIHNDLALLKLNKPFQYTSAVENIKLANPNGKKLCKYGQVIGIARIRPDSKISKTILYATVTTKSANELSTPVKIANSVFYSETKWLKSHTLEGDSGGPLICNFNTVPVLYGITSNGFNSTYGITYITEYEAVSEHLDFIRKYVPNMEIFQPALTKETRKQGSNTGLEPGDEGDDDLKALGMISAKIDLPVTIFVVSCFLIAELF